MATPYCSHSCTIMQNRCITITAMKKRPLTQETFIKNTVLLMERHGLSVRDVVERSGLSDRMVRYLISGDRHPTVETAEQLAKAFGITGWQLIMPNLMDFDGDLTQLTGLVNDYLHSDAEGRRFIESAAHREASRKNS